jgi:hypothetical protein
MTNVQAPMTKQAQKQAARMTKTQSAARLNPSFKFRICLIIGHCDLVIGHSNDPF